MKQKLGWPWPQMPKWSQSGVRNQSTETGGPCLWPAVMWLPVTNNQAKKLKQKLNEIETDSKHVSICVNFSEIQAGGSTK